MMTPDQRIAALAAMTAANEQFYRAAVMIGNHPFIEFTGVQAEYIKACTWANEKGIDFSECNKHSGSHLPLELFQVDYLNEKLDCIFTGRSVITDDKAQQATDAISAIRAKFASANLNTKTISEISIQDARKFIADLAIIVDPANKTIT